MVVVPFLEHMFRFCDIRPISGFLRGCVMPFGFWPLIAAVVCAGVLHVAGFRVTLWRPLSLDDEWVAYRLLED